MNESQSWSLPSLNFLGVDLTWLDMYIWLSLLNLAFTVTKHDTTSTTDAFDFSIFWTCSIKATKNDCKCLNVNRILSKNSKKNVSEQQLACRLTWGMNFKLGTMEASLASCEKVIVTSLRYEKYLFGTQFPQSHNSLFFSLFFAHRANAITRTFARSKFSWRSAIARPHFCTLGFAIITRNYYTKLCPIHWSPYHGSSVKLVQYSGVNSPLSNAKVIEILTKDLPLLCNV